LSAKDFALASGHRELLETAARILGKTGQDQGARQEKPSLIIVKSARWPAIEE